jgi:metal-responsive CopG/Arc/MetJ family transcriptional regulator
MGVRAKTEKMSVTLPKELAGEIRSITTRGGISSFFTEALERYISYRKQIIAIEKGFGAWKDKNHPELAASEDTIG